MILHSDAQRSIVCVADSPNHLATNKPSRRTERMTHHDNPVLLNAVANQSLHLAHEFRPLALAQSMHLHTLAPTVGLD